SCPTGASTLGNRHGSDCASQNRCTGSQLLPPRPEITANTGCETRYLRSCASQVAGAPVSSHTCSCQRRSTRNIVVWEEYRVGALVRAAALFLSTKYWFITASMPRRFTGSASGVMMVAKCSTEVLTPGLGETLMPLR